MLLRHHRVVKLILLVIELDDRTRQLRAFFQSKAGRERTGSDVADHDFQRNDLDFADQLLAHVDALHEMRRHPDVVQLLEDEFRDAIVEHALAFDQRMLLGVEGGSVIFEMLDERAGLRAFVKHLSLALINATPLAHSWSL